ncbi:hypothetical protein ACKFKG_10130 [Phormidesmis sp. 146-35]
MNLNLRVLNQVALASLSTLLLPLFSPSAQAQVEQCNPVATPPVASYRDFQDRCFTVRSAQHKNTFGEKNQQLAQLPADYLLMATVVSEHSPQAGQKNRSSGNFNVQGPADRLYWVVLEGNVPNPNIRFNIMRDRSAWKDPVLARDLFHGAITNNVFSQRAIYIANPRGARGYFQVRAYRIGR